MSLWVDLKYLKMISHRLDSFSEKSSNRFACRCHYCGDSKKNKSKARGNFYTISGDLNYKCFNCYVSMKFSTFLKEFDVNLFRDYNMECFSEKTGSKRQKTFDSIDYNALRSDLKPVLDVPDTKSYIPDIFSDLPLIRDLKGSPAYDYCVSRNIPIETYPFRYAENFIEWTKGNSDKFSNWKGKDHDRIIIPWFDADKKIIGYSARDISGNNDPKYIRIFVDKECKMKFFGLDRCDNINPKIVVEGEIDSFTIPNGVAVANGKLHTFKDKNAIFVADKDLRNVHIMRNVKEMIDLGLNVCMIPDKIPYKDLNEMLCNGFTSDEILAIIKDNTFKGIEALMVFNKWKKC